MKISEKTISALGRIVTGDNKMSPYTSGPELVRFFNELGSNDFYYKSGFPSRWDFAERKIRERNDSGELVEVFTQVLHPRRFLDTDFQVEEATSYLNEYLKFDGYELVESGGLHQVRELNGSLVEVDVPFKDLEKDSHLFIDEQIKKCDEKIFAGDYDGAITNARSLLEAVLKEIEGHLDQNALAYDGDLPKLFKRVRGLLLSDPDNKNTTDILKQVLGGLSTIVNALAGMRNIMSDAHAAEFKPDRHHAKLAVNASRTVCDFMVETYQIKLRTDLAILIPNDRRP